MRQLKISQSVTNKNADQLSKYLSDIARCTTVNAEEEAALADRIQRGDRQAKEKLIKANLRFVVSVAKQFQGYGLPLADLINEGNIGLIRAAERFDPSRGFKFISFAVWWIRQAIMEAISQQANIIRVPHNKLMLQKRIKQTQALLEQQYGRMPSAEEIAEYLQLDPTEVAMLQAMNTTAVSLDAPTGEMEEGTLLDVIEDPQYVKTDERLTYHSSLKEELKRAFKSLAKRERQTICYYFGIGQDYPLSLEAIAAKLEVSPERARQIKDKALRIISHTKNAAQLQSFLA